MSSILPIDPALRRFLADEFGSEGEAWLDRVPDLYQTLSQQWHFELVKPLLGGWVSLVYHVRQSGEDRVLKLTYPCTEFRCEVKALLDYAGNGTVQVFEHDLDAVAMLMRLIEPGTTLETMPDEESLPIVIARMKLLRTVSFDLNQYPPLDTWFESLYKPNIEKGWIASELVKEARKVADHLLATQPKPVLLHADLHHLNVLRDGENWTVIDPKGVAGDPSFEPSAFMRNPLGLSNKSIDLMKMHEQRIAIFANELEYDPYRVWGWGFTQTLLSAWWANPGEVREDWYAHTLALGSLSRLYSS